MLRNRECRRAVYARNLAPGLRALAEWERNVHLFTPADVVR